MLLQNLGSHKKILTADAVQTEFHYRGMHKSTLKMNQFHDFYYAW